jgi:hypothetical protein
LQKGQLNCVSRASTNFALVGAFRFALRFPILQQLWKTFDIIGG